MNTITCICTLQPPRDLKQQWIRQGCGENEAASCHVTSQRTWRRTGIKQLVGLVERTRSSGSRAGGGWHYEPVRPDGRLRVNNVGYYSQCWLRVNNIGYYSQHWLVWQGRRLRINNVVTTVSIG